MKKVVFLFMLCSAVILLVEILCSMPSNSIKDVIGNFLFVEGILFVSFVISVLLILTVWGGSI